MLNVRRALLDAAARVFARQGAEGAGLDDVAADAGFTKGAVYSNFGSKEGPGPGAGRPPHRRQRRGGRGGGAARLAPLPQPASSLAIVLMALANGLAMERMVAPDDVPEDLLGQVLALVVGNSPGPATP